MTARSCTGGVDHGGEASGRIGMTPFQSLDFSILKRTRPILENLLTPVIEAGTVTAKRKQQAGDAENRHRPSCNFCGHVFGRVGRQVPEAPADPVQL
ncbi:MAG TPA: hypothetical protein VN999_01045 [Thermoanaerobaculia bacterium]|nr:hypothetical protein [Thermoanaerobaculia bacterium]